MVINLLVLAPVFVAEIVLVVLLVGALGKRLHRAARKNWLALAIRRTALRALAALPSGVGLVLNLLAPEADSIGAALNRILQADPVWPGR